MNGNDPQPSRPSLLWLLLPAVFALGVLVERNGVLPGRAGSRPPDAADALRPFYETWRLVRERYVDHDATDPQRLARGATRGLLASLGDVGHTTYLTPEELKAMEAGLEGEFEGIGAHLTIRKQRPTIFHVIAGSPAEAAGLKDGDTLLEVDGKPVSDLPVDKIVQLVRGPAGTVVKLRVLREGSPTPLDLSVTRGRIDVPTVAWRLLPGEPAVAHVAIHSFGRHADSQLREALRQLRGKGARGVLLDVRGNPGGLKEQAVAVTSEFLKEGNVFLEQDAHGNRTPVPVRPGGVATDVPLVVLIDEGTASSSEIFAGALQDHERAKLVGTKTFGTGTVLQPFRLSDGSAVLLAVAQWLTPKGRQIWHHGIAPDVEVTLPEGAVGLLPETESGLDAAALARSSDRQLLRALELLRGQLRR